MPNPNLLKEILILPTMDWKKNHMRYLETVIDEVVTKIIENSAGWPEFAGGDYKCISRYNPAMRH